MKKILYWLLNIVGWLGVSYMIISGILFNISNYSAYQYYAQHPYYIEYFPGDIHVYKLFFYYSLIDTIVSVILVYWEFQLLKASQYNGLRLFILSILNLFLSSCIFYYAAHDGPTLESLSIALIVYIGISLIFITGLYRLGNYKR